MTSALGRGGGDVNSMVGDGSGDGLCARRPLAIGGAVVAILFGYGGVDVLRGSGSSSLCVRGGGVGDG